MFICLKEIQFNGIQFLTADLNSAYIIQICYEKLSKMERSARIDCHSLIDFRARYSIRLTTKYTTKHMLHTMTTSVYYSNNIG